MHEADIQERQVKISSDASDFSDSSDDFFWADGIFTPILFG